MAAGGVVFDNCFVNDLESHGAAAIVDTLIALTKDGVAVRILAASQTMLMDHVQSLPSVELETGQFADDALFADRVAKVIARTDDSCASLTVVSHPGVAGENADLDGVANTEAVKATDDLMSQLLDITAESHETLVLVTAAAGHPTDVDNATVNIAVNLLGERQIHVPLLGQLGPQREFGVRCPSLVTTDDVATTLIDWFGMAEDGAAASPGRRSLLAEFRDEGGPVSDALILRGPGSTFGLRTDDWYLVTQLPTDESLQQDTDAAYALAAESAALYVKPDDLWDCLDVASQEPDVVERLVEWLIASVTENGD